MSKKPLSFILLSIILISGCKKDTGSPNTPAAQTDVYISGTLGSGDTTHAVYWKNGNQVILPDGGLPAAAGNIVVSGNDVYVSGTRGRSFGYWKNGNYISLNDTISLSCIMTVSASDIYVLSTLPNENHYAGGYYKNGQFSRISPVDSINSVVYSLAVSGQDLLVGVIETDGQKPSIAKYVLNGTAHNLTDGTKFAYVFGVAFSGNDIYAVGGEFDSTRQYCTAKYWKNGVAHIVSGTTGVNMGTHIAISGNDVYIAGYGYDGPIFSGTRAAKYWKNGVENQITDGAYDSEASWIELSGTDVYVVFQEHTLGISPVSKYLKNGTLVQLTDNTRPANAYSSFISVPH